MKPSSATTRAIAMSDSSCRSKNQPHAQQRLGLVEPVLAAQAQRQAQLGELLADRVALRRGPRAGAVVQLVGLLVVAGQQREAAQRGQLVHHVGAQAQLLGDPQALAVQGRGTLVVADDLRVRAEP
ncbi:hypothetical protein [Saccharothrix sp. 6-C]|uniref:hypothetical protein n=1 Tax=Saccharothrix sp. 6-C TaxID=2781735 RepID=UPI001F2855F3|nr:hypothetical protein [Saccharothrix sp. 6-C]